jgi:stage II sporulation protein P
MLANPVTLKKNDSADQPTVMILHTHASEAYVDQSGGRSEDPEHNVIYIGDVLTEVLEAQGIGVVHCRTVIDSPSYSNSYNRAMDIIDEQLSETPSIQMVIDLHRDSMITDSGTEYKVVSEIDGQTCAQLMFVMGTNAGGLTHPNWQNNLSFAANLQKSLLSQYPTLMRPINLRKQRFNEQATTGSMILECGTSANTIQEAELAIRAFGKVLAEELSK